MQQVGLHPATRAAFPPRLTLAQLLPAGLQLHVVHTCEALQCHEGAIGPHCNAHQRLRLKQWGGKGDKGCLAWKGGGVVASCSAHTARSSTDSAAIPSEAPAATAWAGFKLAAAPLAGRCLAGPHQRHCHCRCQQTPVAESGWWLSVAGRHGLPPPAASKSCPPE